MRVCIQKSTGKVLEMQSDAKAGTLLANCKVFVDEADLEEREVTPAEYRALLPPVPVVDRSDVTVADKLLKAACIYLGSLSGKTPTQVKNGIKAVYDALT